MKINTQLWTFGLVSVFLLVLVAEYRIITFSSVALNTPVLTINEVKVGQAGILETIIISVLMLSLFFHTKASIPKVYDAFANGYLYTRDLVKKVASSIAAVCGHDAHGAPYGGFRPTFQNKKINCGKFTMQNGQFSENVIIELPFNLHSKCVLAGLLKVFKLKVFLNALAPIFLGLWAIARIAI